MAFTLAFEGLCAFKERSGLIEVYLLDGGGIHGANLIIPSDLLNIDKTDWKPTKVGLIPDSKGLRQVAMWSLGGMEATFSDGSGKTSFNEQQRMIQFATEHPKSYTLTKAEIQKIDKGVGIVTLEGGSLEPEVPKHDFTLYKDGKEHKTDYFSQVVIWSGNSSLSIKNDKGKSIVLKSDLTGCVANVAPVKHTEGLTHFEHHYYAGVALHAVDVRMKIQDKYTDVYDCVPGVIWP